MSDPGMLLGAATVAVHVAILAALVGAVLVLLVVVWSLKRRRDASFAFEAKAPLAHLLPSLAGLTHGVLVEGNAVDLLENGAFFDRLLADVASAAHTVHFETYLWKEGVLGRRLAEALAARSRDGVAVRVLVDASGSKGMGAAAERILREAGCTLVRYHPGRLRTLGRLNNRDHRKLAVLDGRVGYVGGHCVVDSWLGEAQDRDHFRDLSVRIEGPVVHALQAAFSENWVESTGELFMGPEAFPVLEAKGPTVAHVARIRPSGSPSAVKILHHGAIACARERVRIQNPYFIPDPEGIEELLQAVRRGVDVQIMTPSPGGSDLPLVQYAAGHNYGRLLEGGVRIFEYERTLLHQKVMTIDGVWSAVGSSNFDDRSFEINDEITLGFHDARLARALEEVFERDRADCVELTAEGWARRPLWHRCRAAVLYIVNEQL